MCALPFFFFFNIQLNHAQSSLAIRLSCFVIVFLSWVNAQQWSRATQGPSTPVREREFSSISCCSFFFFFFFLPTEHSQSSVTVVCVLRASSYWWRKIWLPNVLCFRRPSQYPHGERMFEEGKSTNRIVHVVFPYTFRRPALRFRSFSIKPVESARSSSIGFSFSAFFFCESVETEMTQERDQKRPKAWLRNPNAYAYFYCLIADGVRLLVNRWLFFNMFNTFKTARVCRCSQKPTCCSQYQQ